MGNSGSGGARRGGGRWKRGRRGPWQHADISLDDFRTPRGFMTNIGVGAFGRVMAMVKRDEPHRRFAVKCLLKAKVVHKDQIENCVNELNILRRMDHYAYLVNLFYAFQDETTLYMCTDLMLGGTLQRALRSSPDGNLSSDPERICRYAAELTLALQFLHSQNVVHRDVKPDNILLDAQGHLHLTDFNVSIYVQPGTEDTMKHVDGWGTRGYRAPEVYLRTGLGFIFACDWWSLGAVLFELFTGQVPYAKTNPDEPSSELLMRMNSECADFSAIEPELARDFVAKLLRFDPEMRIGCQHGCNSEVMIMTHPYFSAMDWDALERYSGANDIESRNVTENCATADSAPLSAVEMTEGPNSRSTETSMSSYAANFDASLDQKHKLRILQRNMGILGLDAIGEMGEEDDLDDFPSLTDDQQALFKDWAYNVDFKLEQQARPQFTLLQTVSSMSPDQIRAWIVNSNPQSLRALCSEMKAYREQAMKENFDHVMAEMRIDKLIEENLRLTRRVAELQKQQVLVAGGATPDRPDSADPDSSPQHPNANGDLSGGPPDGDDSRQARTDSTSGPNALSNSEGKPRASDRFQPHRAPSNAQLTHELAKIAKPEEWNSQASRPGLRNGSNTRFSSDGGNSHSAVEQNFPGKRPALDHSGPANDHHDNDENEPTHDNMGEDEVVLFSAVDKPFERSEPIEVLKHISASASTRKVHLDATPVSPSIARRS